MRSCGPQVAQGPPRPPARLVEGHPRAALHPAGGLELDERPVLHRQAQGGGQVGAGQAADAAAGQVFGHVQAMTAHVPQRTAQLRRPRAARPPVRPEGRG